MRWLIMPGSSSSEQKPSRIQIPISPVYLVHAPFRRKVEVTSSRVFIQPKNMGVINEIIDFLKSPVVPTQEKEVKKNKHDELLRRLRFYNRKISSEEIDKIKNDIYRLHIFLKGKKFYLGDTKDLNRFLTEDKEKRIALITSSIFEKEKYGQGGVLTGNFSIINHLILLTSGLTQSSLNISVEKHEPDGYLIKNTAVFTGSENGNIEYEETYILKKENGSFYLDPQGIILSVNTELFEKEIRDGLISKLKELENNKKDINKFKENLYEMIPFLCDDIFSDAFFEKFQEIQFQGTEKQKIERFNIAKELIDSCFSNPNMHKKLRENLDKACAPYLRIPISSEYCSKYAPPSEISGNPSVELSPDHIKDIDIICNSLIELREKYGEEDFLNESSKEFEKLKGRLKVFGSDQGKFSELFRALKNFKELQGWERSQNEDQEVALIACRVLNHDKEHQPGGILSVNQLKAEKIFSMKNLSLAGRIEGRPRLVKTADQNKHVIAHQHQYRQLRIDDKEYYLNNKGNKIEERQDSKDYTSAPILIKYQDNFNLEKKGDRDFVANINSTSPKFSISTVFFNEIFRPLLIDELKEMNKNKDDINKFKESLFKFIPFLFDKAFADAFFKTFGEIQNQNPGEEAALRLEAVKEKIEVCYQNRPNLQRALLVKATPLSLATRFTIGGILGGIIGGAVGLVGIGFGLVALPLVVGVIAGGVILGGIVGGVINLIRRVFSSTSFSPPGGGTTGKLLAGELNENLSVNRPESEFDLSKELPINVDEYKFDGFKPKTRNRDIPDHKGVKEDPSNKLSQN